MEHMKATENKSSSKPKHIAQDKNTKRVKSVKKSNSNNKTKAWIISSIVAVAACLFLAFMLGAFTTTHTFDDMSFQSNGVWTVTQKDSDEMLGLPQSKIVAQSGQYSVTVESLVLPEGSVSSYSHGFIDRIRGEKFYNANDVVATTQDGIMYVGGWYNNGDFTTASCVIFDVQNGRLITFELTGPKSHEKKIADIYKTIKFKDVLISSLQ